MSSPTFPAASGVPEGWVVVARLLRPRGNKGEIAAESWTSRPERFQALHTVTLRPSGREIAVESVWWHGDHPVFCLTGVNSISEAGPLSGELVTVPQAERIELEPGEVFYGDLIGCTVLDRATGKTLGTVEDYLEGAGPLLLEVGPHLIPYVPAICVVVDTAAKRIEVDLPEGFLELNQ